MNIPEAAELLAVIAAYDGRDVTRGAAAAWAAILDDIPSEQAQHAVMEFFKVSDGIGLNRISPARIRADVTHKQRRLIVEAWGHTFERLTGEGVPADQARAQAQRAADQARELYPLGAAVMADDAGRRHELVLEAFIGKGVELTPEVHRDIAEQMGPQA